MLNFSIVGTLLGAAFGLRFKVLVLFPLIAAEFAIAALNGIAIGESVAQHALVMVLVATSIQLGYLGAAVFLPLIGAARSTPYDKAPLSAGASRPAP